MELNTVILTIIIVILMVVVVTLSIVILRLKAKQKNYLPVIDVKEALKAKLIQEIPLKTDPKEPIKSEASPKTSGAKPSKVVTKPMQASPQTIPSRTPAKASPTKNLNDKKPALEPRSAWYKYEIKRMLNENPALKKQIDLSQFQVSNDSKAVDLKRLYSHTARLNEKAQATASPKE